MPKRKGHNSDPSPLPIPTPTSTEHREGVAQYGVRGHLRRGPYYTQYRRRAETDGSGVEYKAEAEGDRGA